MADQENASLIFDQCLLQSFFCIHIQMIGRLVQKQNVRFFIHQLTQTHLRLLPATQYTYLTFNMLGSQTAFGESRPHFILSIRRKLRSDLINTGSLVITLYFLLKISNLKILPKFAGTLQRRDQPQNTLQ